LARRQVTLARRVLTLSTTPWILFISAVLVVALPIALPFVADKVATAVFETVVLVALAEGLLALYLVVSTLESTSSLAIERLHVVDPPGSINQELLELIVQLKQGRLTLICYGSNRFGKVLDTVSEHLSRMATRVMVCSPDHALDFNDGVAIQDLIGDMETISHINVYTTPLMPTIRAAVVHDERGTAVWASASFYLVYNHRRALRSEGRSPVFKVDDPRSPMMPVMVDFILKEFDRLATADGTNQGGQNEAH
jgi:hypothetical protein